MLSLSKITVELIERQILPRLEELNCEAYKLKNGATVIDMGINAPGSYEAARLFTLVTLGGIGEVEYMRFREGKIDLPAIWVSLARPQEASLSSQFSCWKIKKTGKYQLAGFGSGPARALAANDHVSAMWHYRDHWDKTALALQMSELPDEGLAQEVASACGIDPSGVYLLAATTGSLVGCVQICARMPEVSLWGLGFNGFPVDAVRSFSGYGVIAPSIDDDLIAMDRVNTSTFYGSCARYIVDCEDADIEKVLPKMAYADTPHYKKTFQELFDASERDIFKMDVSVHKVAVIELNNVRSGKSFRAGLFDEEMLYKSFFENTL